MVLVGFMGAGKSTVGRSAARSLGWHFVDLDEVVEAEAGRTIAEIFERDGEAYFRRLEMEASLGVLGEDRVVIATGGGWAAQPGAFDRIPPRTATVWLQVGYEEALRRATSAGGARPLLSLSAGGEPAGKAVEKLFAERVPCYSLADWRVDTEGNTVEDVTARVLKIAAENESETGTE